MIRAGGMPMPVPMPVIGIGMISVIRSSSSSVRWRRWLCSSSSSSSSTPRSLNSNPKSLRFGVLGAGFAGLSVAWHLLQHSPKEKDLPIHIDIFDEFGIGGGASGVAGGLLHPYNPKVKPIWNGDHFWKECLNLINVAQLAAAACTTSASSDQWIVRRRGILRPAVSDKNLDAMRQNAQHCLASCPIEIIDNVAARELMPNLNTPLNTAFFMPQALNVNPQIYLQALFLACEDFVKRLCSSGFPGSSITLHKKFVPSLGELEDEYDAVVVCLGARVDMLPELCGILPLRLCRGVIADLQLLDVSRDCFLDHSPSILSDAWMAIQGPQSLSLGSTWDWESRNYSSAVSLEENSRALQELLSKASSVYPQITNWTSTGARAGLRAMGPVTPHGSYPLLGCIDDLIGGHSNKSKYWLIGGLGARGLLFHGWLGKLTAQAVLSCNEDLIPSELTSWRKMKKK